MSEAMTRAIIKMPLDMAMSTDLSRIQFHARAQGLLADAERLAAEQAVMRQWIAEALPVLGSIDSEGECHAVNSEATLQFLRDLRESGRKLVDGGPDDLLKGVE